MDKLNKAERKLIRDILNNRRAVHKTPIRKLDGPNKECKIYEAALSLYIKGIIKISRKVDVEFEGPHNEATQFYYECKPWKTKRELRRVL
tara:strand:+ start:4538 stop:4807 length:270 start_codon:yes stop_codon:yes gene_type:complete